MLPYIFSAAGEPQQDPSKKEEDLVWAQLAFPFYMQSSSQHHSDVCKEFEDTLRGAQGAVPLEDRPACVWKAIRCAPAAAALCAPLRLGQCSHSLRGQAAARWGKEPSTFSGSTQLLEAHSRPTAWAPPHARPAHCIHRLAQV